MHEEETKGIQTWGWKYIEWKECMIIIYMFIIYNAQTKQLEKSLNMHLMVCGEGA